ncbi:MAG: hypothetical protein IKH37_07675 [Prevotella sp.]|nr:hypothetical protein [Prevotella sp.]
MRSLYHITISLLLLSGTMLSCNSRHNMADLQQKIDSVRALENKEYLKASGIDLEERSPIEEFFDSLRIQTLPLRGTADYVTSLPNFITVPIQVAPIFDVSNAAELKAKSLPETLNAKMMMLAVDDGSGESAIWLCSLDIDYRVSDKLLLYSPHPVYDAFNRPDTRAFLITSDYLISLQEYDAETGTVKQQNFSMDDGRHFIPAN